MRQDFDQDLIRELKRPRTVTRRDSADRGGDRRTETMERGFLLDISGW